MTSRRRENMPELDWNVLRSKQRSYPIQNPNLNQESVEGLQNALHATRQSLDNRTSVQKPVKPIPQILEAQIAFQKGATAGRENT